MRLWIGLALIAFCARTNLADYDEYMGLDKEFRDRNDYLPSSKNIDDNVDLEKKLDDDNENEEKNNEDIENFYKSLENVDDKSIESVLNDYQIEDNRSELKDEQNFLPLDNQNDIVDASDENKNLSDMDNFFADFNDSPVLEDKNQSDGDDIYNMDGNSNIEPLKIENRNILIKNIPGAEENDENNFVDEEMGKQISSESNPDLGNIFEDENKPLDAVDDTLDKVFDDAENVERIQKTIESIEKTNELVNDLAGVFVDSKNVEDESEQKVQGEASYEDLINLNGDSDEMQQSFNEDLDDQEINESDEEQPADDDKLDTINASQELKQPVSQQDAHNYNTNIDNESENDDENGKQLDGFEQIDSDSDEENDSDEDTVDTINDLNDDYENLFETWKDLQEDDTIKTDDNNQDLYDKKSNERDEEQPADVDHLDTRDTPEDLIKPLSEGDYQNYDINHEEHIVEGNIDNESESSEDENKEHSNVSEQVLNENQALEGSKMSAEDTYDQNNSDEDTFAKIYNSDDDSENLFETWEKLQEDDTKENDNVLDYEEKYNKPYREGNILSVRNYDDDIKGDSEEGDEIKNMSEINQKNKYIEDADISPDMAPMLGKKNISEGLVMNDPAFYLNITVDEREEKDKMEITTIMPDNNDKYENTQKYGVRTDVDYDDNGSTVKTVEVDNLTPEQYEDMMKQFAVVHSEDLDTKSGDTVAPIHMVITADEPVVIESPDYPNNYPTNNVIDYFFDGLGTGIEFNISEFSVNGILGDYLLVKPGGIDVSGSSGVVFSYHLNNKRQYRFTDVDKLFVRFLAHPGPALFKGYQFSVKMISPPDEDEELQPEPEPLLPPPASLTVTLGGSSLEDFSAIQEDFRLLIADMATMYINANGIAAGLNTTSETAQITGTALCNIYWPGYESCVAVTFGVPLAHGDDQPARLNDEDLRTMWDTYVQLDPFASRLRRMGITEFAAPNDRRVLTVWLVLAAGVLISVAMLAIALWRFSCFEDYTRMAAYSDTDSVNEKRVLDMYPTPHQTFPALYGEQQLTWDDDKFDDTTRVDMGGYANKNYVRDDMVELDSDEDVITTPRDRNSFSPRDVYQV